MKKVSCLIIDDEPLARSVLEGYLVRLPFLELKGTCRNVPEAIQQIHLYDIGLIFCDIKMPGINGIDFVRSLHNSTKIILTTAFSEYALEAFNIGVTDYLLKPFSFERFLLAVNRALNQKNENQSLSNIRKEDFIFFKTSHSSERVFLKNIDFIEAYGNYCKLHLIDSNKMLVVNYKISDLEKLLSEFNFIRIHKSYIVNKKFVKKITTSKIFLDENEISLGEIYKKNLDLLTAN